MVIDVEYALDWRGKRYRDVARGLQVVAKDVDQSFSELNPLVRTILSDYMKSVVIAVRARMDAPYPGGTSPAGQFPGSLSTRSGRLLSQMTPARINIVGSLDNSLDVSFTLPGIAAVHERGATIRPKRAKFLTVPLPGALNANGTPKKPRARDWANTFILQSKKGNLLIMQKQAGGDLLPLYVLKKSVTIPRRLGFAETFEAGLDFLADKIAQEIVREFVP